MNASTNAFTIHVRACVCLTSHQKPIDHIETGPRPLKSHPTDSVERPGIVSVTPGLQVE